MCQDRYQPPPQALFISHAVGTPLDGTHHFAGLPHPLPPAAAALHEQALAEMQPLQEQRLHGHASDREKRKLYEEQLGVAKKAAAKMRAAAAAAAQSHAPHGDSGHGRAESPVGSRRRCCSEKCCKRRSRSAGHGGDVVHDGASDTVPGRRMCVAFPVLRIPGVPTAVMLAGVRAAAATAATAATAAAVATEGAIAISVAAEKWRLWLSCVLACPHDVW